MPQETKPIRGPFTACFHCGGKGTTVLEYKGEQIIRKCQDCLEGTLDGMMPLDQWAEYVATDILVSVEPTIRDLPSHKVESIKELAEAETEQERQEWRRMEDYVKKVLVDAFNRGQRSDPADV